MSDIDIKIEELWDQGNPQAFNQFEQELKSQASDKDAAGCVTMARFYYLFSLLHDEKQPAGQGEKQANSRVLEQSKASHGEPLFAYGRVEN